MDVAIYEVKELSSMHFQVHLHEICCDRTFVTTYEGAFKRLAVMGTVIYEEMASPYGAYYHLAENVRRV